MTASDRQGGAPRAQTMLTSKSRMTITRVARLNLTHRPRRLRRTPALRALVRETKLAPERFIYPLFVRDGEGERRPIASMPGVFQLSVDEVVREAAAAKADGIGGVILFGLPPRKDLTGSTASDADGPVQTAVRAIKREVRDLVVVTDVCLCEYTSHGHCGILVEDEATGETELANDASVEELVKAAVSHAVAGADVVAPSDMMDAF